MGEITTLTRSTSKNQKSVRTTVPMGVTAHFGLVEGDQLEWFITSENNKLCIRVEPRKKL